MGKGGGYVPSKKRQPPAGAPGAMPSSSSAAAAARAVPREAPEEEVAAAEGRCSTRCTGTSRRWRGARRRGGRCTCTSCSTRCTGRSRRWRGAGTVERAPVARGSIEEQRHVDPLRSSGSGVHRVAAVQGHALLQAARSGDEAFVHGGNPEKHWPLLRLPRVPSMPLSLWDTPPRRRPNLKEITVLFLQPTACSN